MRALTDEVESLKKYLSHGAPTAVREETGGAVEVDVLGERLTGLFGAEGGREEGLESVRLASGLPAFGPSSSTPAKDVRAKTSSAGHLGGLPSYSAAVTGAAMTTATTAASSSSSRVGMPMVTGAPGTFVPPSFGAPPMGAFGAFTTPAAHAASRFPPVAPTATTAAFSAAPMVPAAFSGIPAAPVGIPAAPMGFPAAPMGLPAAPVGFPAAPGGGRGGERRENTKVRVLAMSGKVIKLTIKENNDIVNFLDALAKLESIIRDLYSEETEQLKVQIALNQLGDKIRSDGDAVYESMGEAGDYDLGEFFRGIYRMSYPAPQSTLDLGFRNLKQGGGTVSEYARKFRTVVGLLGYNLTTFTFKFIDGLTNAELRQAIRRQNIEGMEFQELVALISSINNSLSTEKQQTKVFFGAEVRGESKGEAGVLEGWGGGDEEDERICKILGVPVQKYFKKADEKKVSRETCWNCFNKGHQSLACVKKNCKFCARPTQVVKHLSLICPKAPSDFRKFFEARENSKKEQVKMANERIPVEFDDYYFSSDELSD